MLVNQLIEYIQSQVWVKDIPPTTEIDCHWVDDSKKAIELYGTDKVTVTIAYTPVLTTPVGDSGYVF